MHNLIMYQNVEKISDITEGMGVHFKENVLGIKGTATLLQGIRNMGKYGMIQEKTWGRGNRRK